MQNRYVADVGDFGKYGLLKALCQQHSMTDGQTLRLGVVWYLVPDESHSMDGKHIKYLEPTNRNTNEYRHCDTVLYDALKEIVLAGSREVERIREHQVLPSGTVYYEAPLAFGLVPQGERIFHRSQWARDALDLTARCDIVFLDPDNGLEVKMKPHQAQGPKYAFFEEILPYLQRQQSVVIYHHIGRQGSASDQVQVRLRQIRKRLDTNGFAMLYHRGTARAFFIVPAQRHSSVLLHRANGFVRSAWSRHFELMTLAQSEG